MKPELLAPANINTLTTAVQAGADAVYIGGTRFGARQYADNFDIAALEKAIDYAHLRGVKVYITTNILVGDSEISEFLLFVKEAYNIGADAFILQDIGMAMRIKELLPEAKLHASTQLTVHNTQGAAFMKELGFERVVTARELSKEEVADIVKNSGVEIEMFVHGALCMSYSGQCLMSSMIGARSGNRGACAQPCRLPYGLVCGNKKLSEGYLLSPKDLSLSGNIDDIFDVGAASLKIEGRMKGPEYVAAAVLVFRKLIDEKRNATEEEKFLLENAFSRGGFTGGCFTSDFKNYMRPESGNDDIYKNRDNSLLKQLKPFSDINANFKRNPVEFTAKVFVGENFWLKAESMGEEVTLEGEVVQMAQNKPTSAETIEKQIEKTGDFPFAAQETNVSAGENVFVTLSEINSLRRHALSLLEEKIAGKYKHNAEIDFLNKKTKKENEKTELFVWVSNEDQLKEVRKVWQGGLFVPCELDCGEEDIAVFPDIIKNSWLESYEKIMKELKSCKICTANYAIIKMAKKYGKEIIGSSALNVFNSETVSEWEKYGLCGVFLSEELNLGQVKSISSKVPVFVTAYGKSVMMKTAVCPVKAAMGKCLGEKCESYLKDRKNETFGIMCDKQTTFILNSKPIYMADKLSEIEKANVFGAVIKFTDETGEKCRDIIKKFVSEKEPDGPFTRGHYYRGVT